MTERDVWLDAVQEDMFAPPDAETRRDEGMRKVDRPNFSARVREFAITYLNGQEVTGEDIRVACVEHGIVPHHHNAWGAAIRPMIGTILMPTNKRKKAQTSKSHARVVEIYLVCA